MIRRSPTLINMSDFDVQDVRDVVAKQKTDSSLMLKMKRMAENPAMDNEDMEMLDQLKARYGDREKRDAGASTTAN
ncbi:hypothetical protein DFH08DRAFT_869612 [Mycena albidolilacea]|uniref:Uncharacterized protein n=1 Tax=Mycena albidolilacea TaxID=1033008 RepID=A0AAD7A131_9AGAR|nr:hypothetical protein DFH08DRAFT_869612 [Mycena albidolilacea]